MSDRAATGRASRFGVASRDAGPLLQPARSHYDAEERNAADGTPKRGAGAAGGGANQNRDPKAAHLHALRCAVSLAQRYARAHFRDATAEACNEPR